MMIGVITPHLLLECPVVHLPKNITHKIFKGLGVWYALRQVPRPQTDLNSVYTYSENRKNLDNEFVKVN